MFFRQFKVEGMGCLSYMIGCPRLGRAFVVDPKRDVRDYLSVAERERMEITGIIETHLHADHVSGAWELQAETNAPIYIGEGTPVSYEARFVKDGEVFAFGSVRIEVVSTPGHTPASITLAVSDLSRGNLVQLLLTGDLLFVGSVGRPDLAGDERLEEQARNLYESLHEKLGRFEDQVEVFPAHGEGSACGKGISAKPSSTLGYERRTNPYFSLDLDAFVREIKAAIPRRPRNFSHILETNSREAPSVSSLSPVYPLGVLDLKRAIGKGFTLIDLRDAACFGGAHIPGSLNIGFAPSSTSWLSDVVDPAAHLVLVAPGEEVVKRAVTMFRRAGYDRIYGFSIGVMDWVLAGEKTGFLPQLSVHGLHRVLEKYENHVLLDVRTGEEWEAGHVSGAVHIPIHDLLNEEGDLSGQVTKETHVSVICRSGYRSNIAASYLKSRGYAHVYSVIGGMSTWEKVYGAREAGDFRQG